MKISECCGAIPMLPTYDNMGICSQCKDNTEFHEEEIFTKEGLFDGAKLVNVINSGDTVCCDGCNGPYGDNVNGGVIIGHSAYCGECADKYRYYSSDYEHKHEINEFMDLNKSFKDNVLEYRKRTTGSSDGIMRIFTMD
jgi:hypothetical protein